MVLYMILNSEYRTATILKVIRIPPTPDIALKTGSNDIHPIYCNVACTAYDLISRIPNIAILHCNHLVYTHALHPQYCNVCNMCATYHSENVSPIWNATSITPALFYATTFMPNTTTHAKVWLTTFYLLVSHILFASSCRVCFSVL